MRWILAAAAFLALFVLGAAGWLLYTGSGLRWAAEQAQGVSRGTLELAGLRGALASRIEVESIRYRDETASVTLHNAAFRLEFRGLLAGRAALRSLRAESLEVMLAVPGEKPRERRAPALAFGLQVDRARLERMVLEHGPQRYVIEDFELRDAVLQPAGKVSAEATFAFPHERYRATGRLSVGGTLKRLEVALEGRVADVPARARAVLAPASARPLEAIEARGGPLDLSRLNAAWPTTALTLEISGAANARDALAGRLSAHNAAPGSLTEQRLPLAVLETGFATPDFGSVSLVELNAVLAPGGALAGSGTLRVDAAAFEVYVAELGVRLSADIERDGDRVALRSVRAEANGGSATGSGELRLSEPMRFDASLRLEHLDPARFGDYPGGDLNGRVDASGTLDAEPALDVRWSFERSTLGGRALESRGAARVARSRVTQITAQATFGSARLKAQGDLGRAGDKLGWSLAVSRIEEFAGRIGGRLQASGTLSGTLAAPRATLHARATELRLGDGITLKSATLKANGRLDRHVIELSARAEGLHLGGRLRGGWDIAQGWSGELQALRSAGAYPVQVGAPVALRIAPGRVELGRLEATLGGGRLRISELLWSENRLRSSGEFSALPAQWIVVTAGLTRHVRSSLRLDGQWNITAAPRLAGSASVRRSAGDLTITKRGALALGLEKVALDARFDDGRIRASTEVVSKYATASVRTDIAPQPGAPGLGITPRSALVFDAEVGAVDLRVAAQPLLSDARIEGRLFAVLHAEGNLARPAVTGTVRGEALAFEMPQLGIFLRNGLLHAALEGDALRVKQFHIEAGEGRLTASGLLPLRAAHGDARLAWSAEKFGLLARPGLRLVVSGTGEARLADEGLSLTGSLRADHGHFELAQERLPELSDDVVIIGQEPKEQPRARPVRAPLALELHLDLGDELQLRAQGLEGKLAGQLHLATQDGEPRLHGQIRMIGATFVAFGQRLFVDPGVATFDGAFDNPSLQMTAWRRNQAVEVGVQISGTAQAPSVQLVSQPPVPEQERLSWLVLGRASNDVNRADLGLLMVGAGAVFARGDQLPLNRRLANAFGLDDIRLRGGGEVGERVVAVSRRLSDRLYVSYEQGLSAAASSLVRLDLSLTRRLALRAETGTSSGAGLHYRFSWD